MKKYQGEKAIISLTSWEARIATVGLTLYSLLTMCPGFHIVLCLSADEFPRMMKDMPHDIQVLASASKIEILWVKKNYKAFKKYMFTMLKYPDVPVISADDDCIYIVNYAERLYSEYKRTGLHAIRYTPRDTPTEEYMLQGPCTIYAPNNVSHLAEYILGSITSSDISISQDDSAVRDIIKRHGLTRGTAKYSKLPFIFHDMTCPINKGQDQISYYKGCF